MNHSISLSCNVYNYKLIFTLLCIFSFTNVSISQERKEVKKSKVNKSIVIELEDEFEPYYKSFFKKLKGDQLTLVSEIIDYETITYEQNTVDLNNFNYIKIKNKKENAKRSILAGLALGTVSFFLVKTATKTDPDDQSLSFVPNGSSGKTEGLIAAGVGFGLGTILYDGLFNKKLSIKENKKEVLKKLKKIRL